MDIATILENIYEKHFGLFCKIGQQTYGLDRDTTIDLIQDTFIVILNNKDKIKSNTNAGIRSYLITVFRNNCIASLKKKRIQEISTDSTNSILCTHQAADTLNELMLLEECRLQNVTINRLPVKYQKPVRLYLEGYKPKEIAEELDMNRSTTRSILMRGLKKYEQIIISIDPLRKEF